MLKRVTTIAAPRQLRHHGAMTWPSKIDVLRTLVAWLAAVTATTLLGCIVQTQFNLAALVQLGAQIPLPLRLQTTAQDLLGFSPSFGPLVAVGFLIAFAVTRGLRVWTPGPRWAWYGLAGGVAVFTILQALAVAFDITPVAAARTALGLLSLAACGALGGSVFAWLLPNRDEAGA